MDDVCALRAERDALNLEIARRENAARQREQAQKADDARTVLTRYASELHQVNVRFDPPPPSVVYPTLATGSKCTRTRCAW